MSQKRKNHQWPTMTEYRLGKICTHYANRGHSYSGEEKKECPKSFQNLIWEGITCPGFSWDS